jgi:hypothetical protein
VAFRNNGRTEAEGDKEHGAEYLDLRGRSNRTRDETAY